MISRRRFVQQSVMASVALPVTGSVLLQGCNNDQPGSSNKRMFNARYENEYLNRIAFPVGGMGAGIEKEGPKYQYGTGCLSDGVLGSWMSLVCGMPEVLDREKVKSHLVAIHKYNLRADLSEHANPQRPTYAMGNEAGLLLCSWPKGGKLQLPFVYSDEVWTFDQHRLRQCRAEKRKALCRCKARIHPRETMYRFTGMNPIC